MTTNTEDSMELKYCLELGVEGEERTRCALEVGLFTKRADALNFAEYVHGDTIARAEENAQVLSLSTDEYDREDGDEDRTIIGATLIAYTDELGTVENIDLY